MVEREELQFITNIARLHLMKEDLETEKGIHISGVKN